MGGTLTHEAASHQQETYFYQEQAGISLKIDQVQGANPFAANVLARANSSYFGWRHDKLIHPLETERLPAELAGSVHQSFRDHVLNSGFPCVGAKAAIKGNTYRFGFYEEMNAPATSAGMAHDLWEYARELNSFETNYATFVACFATPTARDEREWESMAWSQLQNLHDLDRPHHKWDPAVSSDPENPGFSFSFAERAFFVVGLHPASSRDARRFSRSTLVFNAHSQFERLRERNQFERIRDVIRTRDYNLQGSINPNLSDFGERSEALQYSGRAVDESWRCPFNGGRGKAENQGD